MFPELFLERLSYLCEISGRECMQAFCSAWTPNTHHTARLNVIICSKREIHCKANYATLQCVLTPRRERCQGNLFFFFFPTKHTRSTTVNHEAPRKTCSRVASSRKTWPRKEEVSLWGRRDSPCAGCSHRSCSYHLQDCEQKLCPAKYLFLLKSSFIERTYFFVQ